MIKFILPVIIFFLIVLFWEKISDYFLKRFKIKLNYIVLTSIIVAIGIIILLLNY